ncbi:hypothetical protein C3495_02840 [Clostridiaceae bacterium 14S0207]|nr:hypothetical protein C3495_02840 [Clostridiaceae bacterium 14S0207]
MNKKKSIVMLIMVCFFLSNLTACIEKKDGINHGDRDNLIYNLEQMPKDLTMVHNNKIREKDLLFAVFEGLVKEEEGSIEPAIAEDWLISNDRIQYDFKIRKDAKWSNGENITAMDFQEFFKWILKEGKDNYFIKELKCIYGVEEYMKGKSNFDNVAIKAKENNILEIRLNYPCSYFLNILSQPLLTLREKNFYTDNYKTNFNKVNYSGPFEIYDVKDNKQITIKGNSHYWDKNSVKSKKIAFVTINESEDALVQFESYLSKLNYEELNEKDNKHKIFNFIKKVKGKEEKNIRGNTSVKKQDYKKVLSNIDLMVNPPRNEVGRLSQQNFIKTYGSFRTLDLIFNVAPNNIGRDLNFRKAIKSTLSNKIVRDLLDNKTTETSNSIIPSSTSNGKGGELGDRNYFSFNPNLIEAKQYLKKVNFNNITLKEEKKDIKSNKNGSVIGNIDKNNITLIYEGKTFDRLLGKNIKEELEKSLGLNVETKEYNENEFLNAIKDGNYSVALVNFQGSIDNPICFLNQWQIGNFASEVSGYKNPSFDQEVNSAKTENDLNLKYSNIEKAEKTLSSDVPVIPIFNFNTVLCKREYVHGIYVTKSGNIRFNKAYKDKI